MKRTRAIILKDGMVLLGLDAKTDEYGLPGGSLEHKENIEDGLYREVKEETSLDSFYSEKYLFEHWDNHTYLLYYDGDIKPDSSKDPDKEFTELEWFSFTDLPDNLSELAEDIIFKYLHNINEALAGVVEVYVDEEKVYELSDDEIWETLPKLAQERTKGKKISFKQVLDNGEVIDHDPITMPVINASNTVDIFQDLTIEIHKDGVKVKEVGAGEYTALFDWIRDERANGHSIECYQVLKDGEKIDLNPDAMPNSVESQTRETTYLYWPVAILGDNFHITAKFMGDIDVTAEEVGDLLSGIDKTPPMDIQYVPVYLHPNDGGKVPVLKLINWPENLKKIHDALEPLRSDEYPDYIPHITVPEDLWRDILYHDLTSDDLDLEVGPLTLQVKGEVAKVWDEEGNKVIGFNTERAIQMKVIYKLIDELLTRYIPSEKTRPSAEIVYGVDYLAKTTWKKHNGKIGTKISVNQKILGDVKRDVTVLRQVLSHEIIHHHLYVKYGDKVKDHGDEFLDIAEKINKSEGEDYITPYANDTEFKNELSWGQNG